MYGFLTLQVSCLGLLSRPSPEPKAVVLWLRACVQLNSCPIMLPSRHSKFCGRGPSIILCQQYVLIGNRPMGCKTQFSAARTDYCPKLVSILALSRYELQRTCVPLSLFGFSKIKKKQNRSLKKKKEKKNRTVHNIDGLQWNLVL